MTEAAGVPPVASKRYDGLSSLHERGNTAPPRRPARMATALLSPELHDPTDDSLGRMLTRKLSTNVDPSVFEWDGWDLLREVPPDGVETLYHAPEGELTGFRRGGSMFHIHSDVVGSIFATTDAEARSERTFLDSWGNKLSTNTSTQTGLDFLGAHGIVYDPNSDWHYIRQRWYDSNLGRFASRDIWRNGANPYIYGANNPVSFRDVTGNQEESATEVARQKVLRAYERLRLFTPLLGGNLAEVRAAVAALNPTIEVVPPSSIGEGRYMDTMPTISAQGEYEGCVIRVNGDWAERLDEEALMVMLYHELQHAHNDRHGRRTLGVDDHALVFFRHFMAYEYLKASGAIFPDNWQGEDNRIVREAWERHSSKIRSLGIIGPNPTKETYYHNARYGTVASPAWRRYVRSTYGLKRKEVMDDPKRLRNCDCAIGGG